MCLSSLRQDISYPKYWKVLCKSDIKRTRSNLHEDGKRQDLTTLHFTFKLWKQQGRNRPKSTTLSCACSKPLRVMCTGNSGDLNNRHGSGNHSKYSNTGNHGKRETAVSRGTLETKITMVTKCTWWRYGPRWPQTSEQLVTVVTKITTNGCRSSDKTFIIFVRFQPKMERVQQF